MCGGELSLGWGGGRPPCEIFQALWVCLSCGLIRGLLIFILKSRRGGISLLRNYTQECYLRFLIYMYMYMYSTCMLFFQLHSIRVKCGIIHVHVHVHVMYISFW